MRTLGLAFSFAVAAVCAEAQSLERENLWVNDLAGVLFGSAEAQLEQTLEDLHRDIGTEMTVLTIGSRHIYGDAASIESFATGIFNQWGLGTQSNNSGILILVAKDDRDMRIELGADYPSAYDRVASGIIKEAFLPAFRGDDYQGGILAGVDQTISHIAEPFARGEDAPKGNASDTLVWLMAAGGLSTAGLVGAVVARIRRKCPQCGEQSLVRRRVVLQSATRMSSGQGRRHADCAKCGYSHSALFTIPMISDSSSGSSSGGGHSSGGGASGSW